MKVICKVGREDIATVYIARMGTGKFIEFVESVQPNKKKKEKWVLIVSTLYGCPIGCRFCDAGSQFQGKLSKKEILSQIDYLVAKSFPNRNIPVKKFKIQFARMGEPALNDAVLDILHVLPEIYDAPGLMPCISTVAPDGTEPFFEKLLSIKKERYSHRFQLQFSIHSTDEKLRDWLIPVKKWNFAKIAEYGNTFYDEGGRKITLNFALADGFSIDPNILLKYFDPNVFLIKFTPVNPTYAAKRNQILSKNIAKKWDRIIELLCAMGYEAILSIGEIEENSIGSNCGQYVLRHKAENDGIEGAYSYDFTYFEEEYLTEV